MALYCVFCTLKGVSPTKGLSPSLFVGMEMSRREYTMDNLGLH